MALWTLFGLSSGKATTTWPAGDDADGQDGLLGMPRYNPQACDEGCRICAEVCPTHAIEAHDDKLSVDYGRCVICQLCTEACPTGAMTPSNDWAFGVRDREDLVWASGGAPTAAPGGTGKRAFFRSLHVRHVDAGSCNGCESELQSPPPGDLLHSVAALRRSTVGDRTGDTPNVRASAGRLPGHA